MKDTYTSRNVIDGATLNKLMLCPSCQKGFNVEPRYEVLVQGLVAAHGPEIFCDCEEGRRLKDRILSLMEGRGLKTPLM